MTLEDQLKNDERLRLVVYDDATGKPITPGTKVIGHPTIGWGRALDVRGISRDEAQYLFNNDRDEVKIELTKRIPWMTQLNEPRQAVLYNMAFNMGVGGVMEFPKMLAAAKAGDFMAAAREMIDSLWSKQVGTRATRLAQQMINGDWC
jgi:lysozyme